MSAFSERHPVWLAPLEESMCRAQRLFLICACLLFLPGCGKTQEIVSTETTQPILASTPTLAAPTLTPPATVQEPSQTAAPTALPDLLLPSPSPLPFLPPGLASIEADNITQLQLLATLPVSEIYQLAFSVRGDKLVTLSEPWDDRFNDYLQAWSVKDGRQLLDVQKLPSPGKAFFSPDESQVYVFFAGKGIDIYDILTGEKIRSITLDDEQLDFSLDVPTVALARYQNVGDSSIIRLVDLDTEQELLNFTEPGMVMSLKFSPNRSLLAIGSQIGNHYRISVREMPSQRLVTDLVDFDSGLVFSPDSALAAISKNGQVTLFSIPWMTWKASYGFFDPLTNPMPMDFSWSHGGDLLALEDRYTIRFLVPETGKELFNLPDACAVRFSPNTTLLVTWCYQGDLKIWGIVQ
jgi:WD40 repeat protein